MQKNKVEGDEASARRDGIKEKDDKKKEGTKVSRKKGCTNVKRCKNLCEEKDEKGADM